MRELGKLMGGPNVFSLDVGTNLGGTPWTQLSFSPGGPPDFDSLFYRLDAWPGSSAELTLRQSQKPVVAGKPQRLAMLRRLFQESIDEHGGQSTFNTKLKVPSSKVQEAKVVQASIPPMLPRLILEQLPSIHSAFVRRLRTVGWPLRGEGIVGRSNNATIAV